jgi:cell fate regulator YaaT (PSP1 superfamily)
MTTETPPDKGKDVEHTRSADDAPPPQKDPKGGRKGRPRSYLPVAFRPAGRAHRIPIDPRRFNLKPGTLVVVETDRGLAIARVLASPQEDVDPHFSRHVRKVVRPAREPDLLTHNNGKKREPELLAEIKEIALHSGLDLKIVTVDFQAIGEKLTVFFTSERRVDFRNLVKELSQKLQLRIEMRQVGVRDEAKQLGAIAHCGRELCCCSWLQDFCAVSIRMAKDQNLALSPNKISGLCGRLMCCLNYEHAAYAEARKGLPKAGKRVLSRKGPGRVLSLDVLERKFLFLADDGTRRTLGPDDLERDEEGRPIRPPPPGESMRQGGDRGQRPPRRDDKRGGDKRGGDKRGGDKRGGDKRGGDRREGDRREGGTRGDNQRGGGEGDGAAPQSSRPGRGPTDRPDDNREGDEQKRPRSSRRSRRGRGRKRSRGPRKEPNDAG